MKEKKILNLATGRLIIKFKGEIQCIEKGFQVNVVKLMDLNLIEKGQDEGPNESSNILIVVEE